MKKYLTVFAVLLLVTLSACLPSKAPSESLGNNSENSPTQSSGQPVPEVSTTLPNVPVTPSDSQPSSPTSILFEDNGKAFHFRVGDSFLLNLGTDVYEWTVTVDNQDVIALKIGVMVIKGAQGIFDAIAPGTANLTAVGDPLCRKLSPPCAMPTILFKVTLIVE